VDMVKEINYIGINHPELPPYFGQIDGLEKFDAQFFRVTKGQATSFDPLARKIMEESYSAIFDAGINPETLKGSKLGVFVGSSLSDSATINLYEVFKMNGFVISGSMACLEMAYQRLKAGDCDTALVGGCIHSMNPVLTLNMKRAGLLCADGKTKCFDLNGDGFVRSDAINMIYTEVYHVKGKYFSKPDALFLPTRDSQDIARFLGEFYEEVDVSPNAYNDNRRTEYKITGISEADGNELDAVGRFFGEEKPIKVGSVKSNMGHTQPVSGACSLTKVRKIIFNNALMDQQQPNYRFLLADIDNILSFQICLAYQRGEIPANLHFNEPQNHITAVKEGKVKVVTENTPFNRSFTAVNNFSITGANFHVLLKGHYKPKVCKRSLKLFEFLILQNYLGNDNFVNFQICDKVLKAKGLNIISIITENDSGIFDNILHSFVGITAVQIGLTDVLKSMDLLPDKIIGHSLGEIACAYADCCFTTEEAILVRDICPPEIDIACRNSCESTTISGPAQDIDKFVAYLTSCSIFAKPVASNNIAFHSRYIADAGPILLAKMKEFLKDPKTRSKKWLSTCFLPENWTNAICQYASPEYFTYNILNTVYFEETAKFIPDDAIVIEIAPHGLMQAIIKRSHVNCINVPLTRRGEKDNVLFMLKAIGTLYQAGLNPDVDAIYPIVGFPVSTETPVLSHFVEWDHSEEW
ncbi:Fatty acid synthase, partial [Operophtera brumata]